MIKFLVMDVDGTLTDGKIYFGADGEMMKAFDVKDGFALHSLLGKHAIIPVVITARTSPMVSLRCKELGVNEVYQGVMNKMQCLEDILSKYSSTDRPCNLSNVAYIGDDLLDLQCMVPIKQAGGSVGCPSNAVGEVLAASDFIAPHKGGEGAVRDYADYLIRINSSDAIPDDINRRCIEAVRYLKGLSYDGLALGRHDVDDNFFFNVLQYQTDSDERKPFECHRKYIDIQMLISGEEIMQTIDAQRLALAVQYDPLGDAALFKPVGICSETILCAGAVLVILPGDAHRSMAFDGVPCQVRKIVGKLLLRPGC